MNSLFTKLAATIALVPSLFAGHATLGSISVFSPPQGGTGIGSATVGDVGKCLQVLTASPFTYVLAACGSSGGGSIGVRESGGSFTNVSSLSFEAGSFNITNAAPLSTIKLDWTNGPASRSATQNITGLWTFGNTGSATFAGSINGSKSLTSTKSVTATQFQGTGTASNSFAGSLALSKGLTANSYQGGGLSACSGSSFVQYNNGQFGCATPSSGGTPGGTNQNIQFNNEGVFGGTTGFDWVDGAFPILHLPNDSTIISSRSLEISTRRAGSDNGQDITIDTSDGINNGNGGGIQLVGGASAGVGSGGTLTFTAGNSNEGGGTGGSVNITAGHGDGGSGDLNGSISLTAGNGGNSGFVSITGDLGTFITGAASVSSNLEVSSYASASQYFGAGLTSCTGSSFLQWTAGVFGCGVSSGGGGSSIGVRESGSAFTNVSSLSFDAGMFNITNGAPLSTIRLDWTNGPASRSTANTWSQLQTFTLGASFSAGAEFSTYASAQTYRGGVLALTGTGSNSFAGSLNVAKSLTAGGLTVSSITDTGNLNVTGNTFGSNASLSGSLEVGPSASSITSSEAVHVNSSSGTKSDVGIRSAGGGTPSLDFASSNGTLASPSFPGNAFNYGAINGYSWANGAFKNVMFAGFTTTTRSGVNPGGGMDIEFQDPSTGTFKDALSAWAELGQGKVAVNDSVEFGNGRPTFYVSGAASISSNFELSGYASLSNKVLIGGAGQSPLRVGDMTAVPAYVETNGALFSGTTGNSDVIIQSVGNSAAADSYLNFATGRGTVASASAVISGDEIGRVNFQAWGSGAFNQEASIRALALSGNSGGNIASGIRLRVVNSSGSGSDILSADGLVGNVAITGTASVSSNFEVAGTASASKMFASNLTNSNTGDYLCWNTTTHEIEQSATACSLSSLRYKENVREEPYGLAQVLQMHPILYDLKPEYGTAKNQPGFIAEEAAKVVPYLVPLNAEGKPDNFDYPKYVAVLTKAIQDQQKQIDSLNVGSIGSVTSPTSHGNLGLLGLFGLFGLIPLFKKNHE